MQGYNLNLNGTTPSLTNLYKIETPNILEAALEYHRRGFIVTPLHGKRPILRHWHKRLLGANDLPLYFHDGRNVGVVLGGSCGIVDVDPDNPVAREVMDPLLPDTLKSGRDKSPHSHRWYLCDRAPAPRKFKLPGSIAERLMVDPGEETLVELRSTGQLTMVPPSIHPVDGDRCLWYPGEIREIDGEMLADLVLDVAIAALLVLNRPLGSREWFAVRAAGYLSPCVGPERAEKIVGAASAAFDDEEHEERMCTVRSSLREPIDDPTIDAALAVELERLAPGVPGLISRWCARARRGSHREEV